MINQFLAELDGAQAANDGVLILGATNAPWHVDGAFMRPGRFDRLIFVPPPDLGARSKIASIHCRGNALLGLRKLDEAENSARKALSLDSDDTRFLILKDRLARLSLTRFEKSRGLGLAGCSLVD